MAGADRERAGPQADLHRGRRRHILQHMPVNIPQQEGIRHALRRARRARRRHHLHLSRVPQGVPRLPQIPQPLLFGSCYQKQTQVSWLVSTYFITI